MSSKVFVFLFAAVYLVTVILGLAIMPSKAAALSGSDFQAGRIIDDHIFFDSNTLGTSDIQAFLNSKVPTCDTNGTQPSGRAGYPTRADWGRANNAPPPFTCLKDYTENIPAKSADAYCGGSIGAGVKTAAEIIKEVGSACSVSPKALIVLLQKEQSLVTDEWPWPTQYRSATGYGCPDTAPCDAEYYGFFNQVYSAARQFQRYSKQPDNFNYRTSTTSFVAYNPNSGCGGSNIFIQNQATAALYNYTPYQPNAAALNDLYGNGDLADPASPNCSSFGNRNFWRLYADWFGSPLSGICYNGADGVMTGLAFHKQASREDLADLLIYAGSGTDCIEAHVWNPGSTSWREHIASNHPGISYPDSQVVFGDLDGDGTSYPVLFGLRNTGSGMIEAHVWNKDMKRFLVHTASNRAAVNPVDYGMALADLNGDGRDEPILIAYRNTGSGMIELHAWGIGMQSWMYHIATNQPAVDPSETIVEFGDLNSDGTDEAVLVSLKNTGSGRVEFHVWNGGQWSWHSHHASNMPAINPEDSKVVFADVDGDGADEAVLVGLRNTGSGRVEFHVWNQWFGSWRSNIASNQPAL